MPGWLGVPVPANITFESTGSMAMLQTMDPFIGVSSKVPSGAAIVALVEPHVGPGIDRAGMPRVGQESLDDTVRMHALTHAGPGPARRRRRSS